MKLDIRDVEFEPFSGHGPGGQKRTGIGIYVIN